MGHRGLQPEVGFIALVGLGLVAHAAERERAATASKAVG